MQTTPHAYGVDDIAFSPTPSKACTPSAWITAPNRSPVPSSVLGAGHFKQALLGQFWVAPKQAEIPLRVREAAVFLGVSPQTVYLWVERKQIPHLRVMGRNIRFLKSELEPFRAQFKQEVVNWQDQ